jgi:hypothetical protein
LYACGQREPLVVYNSNLIIKGEKYELNRS